jgi:hypothetical protein
METLAIANTLLTELDQFDLRATPFGLYACEHFRAAPEQTFHRSQAEWQHCLRPALKRLGCRPATEELKKGRFTFYSQDNRFVELRLTRISKLKISHFGNKHARDTSVRLSDRWGNARMDRQLSTLWKPSSVEASHISARILILIGFDPTECPFEKEITGLQKDVQWQKRGVKVASRQWLDRYDRGFSIRLYAWISDETNT